MTKSTILAAFCGLGTLIEACSAPKQSDRATAADAGSDGDLEMDGGAGGGPPLLEGGGVIRLPDAMGGVGSGCEGSTCDAGPSVPAVCGDGKMNRSDEKCDDGNAVSGDGCTANCQQIEGNFVCPTPGQACISTIVCGDGRISAGAESCDDGNLLAGDGCGATCQLEPGFICVMAGEPCQSICGDGILAGQEECEFAAGAPPIAGSGCAIDCKIEPGWDCDAASRTCRRTVCGNNVLERWEQCDDGNAIPFDGCHLCLKEPRCAGGACEPICGDGKRYNSEECDDGNSGSGDGCSATCTLEAGYGCVDVPAAQTDRLALPAIFRDFIGQYRSPARSALAGAQTAAGVRVHPDFNVFFGSGTTGVVATQLGADRLPVYVMPNPGEPANFTGKANFDIWYRDNAAYNRSVLGSLDLVPGAAGLFVFDPPFFGPVDGAGFVPLLDSPITGCGGDHNFSFTTEAHFWFEYTGGEQFDFSGDDDVWVFVANALVIDLGGLHARLDGSFLLDPTQQGLVHRTRLGADAGDVNLNMTFGNVYEVDLFHAEREECASNFRLTLKAFNKPKSQCRPICGDAIVTRGEMCDEGTASNTGTYGHCRPDCRRGPSCGDAIVDPDHEQCDDGVNLSQYGGCAPGCTRGPYCGDGIVQSGFEECDDAVFAGNYDGCDKNCVLGPRCGDGVVQADAGEQCDDGNRANGDGCEADCRNAIVP